MAILYTPLGLENIDMRPVLESWLNRQLFFADWYSGFKNYFYIH